MTRYRFKVIRDNLQSSISYSSGEELKTDISLNYRYLARILRQVMIVPDRQLLDKRLTLNTLPAVEEWLTSGKSVVVLMGHVGNWEWAGLYLGMKYPGRVCALYKQIKSSRVNKWMLKRRGTTVDHLIEAKKMNELVRLIKTKSVLVLMIADQNPGNDQGIIWTDFLQKKTAFTGGPETLATKFQLPVVYLHTTTTREGQYHLAFEIITDGTQNLNKGEITHRYAKALERNILEQRSEWLWSHKRWKRNPELKN